MMKNKPMLITGAAGSGKSHLYEYLCSQKISAVDMDELDGVAGWFNKKGAQVEYPLDASEEWLSQHSYKWNKQELARYIDTCAAKIYLGLSDDDAKDFAELFSSIVYVHVPVETIEARLERRNNHHGQTEEQRNAVLSYISSFDEKAQRNGYIIVDGDQKVENVWHDITSVVDIEF